MHATCPNYSISITKTGGVLDVTATAGVMVRRSTVDDWADWYRCLASTDLSVYIPLMVNACSNGRSYGNTLVLLKLNDESISVYDNSLNLTGSFPSVHNKQIPMMYELALCLASPPDNSTSTSRALLSTMQDYAYKTNIANATRVMKHLVVDTWIMWLDPYVQLEVAKYYAHTLMGTSILI